MWLINVKTYKLEFFQDVSKVKYAILSHRWRTEEVSYADINSFWTRPFSRKKGWNKIQKCCELAAVQGIPYAWVDTCCIDKSSSAELQEAINSMFKWYRYALKCFVYLDDVVVPADIATENYDSAHFFSLVRESEWFRRGWTLQELIAPASPYISSIEIGFLWENVRSIAKRYTSSRESAKSCWLANGNQVSAL